MNHQSNYRSDSGQGRLGARYPDASYNKVDPTDSAPKMNTYSAEPHPTHLESVIAKVIGAHRAATVSTIFSSFLTVASMICVPGIFGATLVMATQRPPIESIALKQDSVPTFVVRPTRPETLLITSPIVLNAQVMRARYMAVLRDDRGRAVYVWPTIDSDNPMTLMGGFTYRIPSTVVPGDYTLHVQVVYKLNPLVTGQVRTDIARVVVVD